MKQSKRTKEEEKRRWVRKGREKEQVARNIWLGPEVYQYQSWYFGRIVELIYSKGD